METLRFYIIKLPLMLGLICFGYLLDFILQWPFMLMCRPQREIAGASRRRTTKVENVPAGQDERVPFV